MKSKIILFLDIDGVLITERSTMDFIKRKIPNAARIFDAECAKNLALILDKCHELNIVISSSWRKIDFLLIRLGAQFQKHGIDVNRIKNCTPNSSHGKRGQEIQDFCAEERKTFLGNKGYEIFPIIIDDDVEDIEPFWNTKLIFKTSFKTGLTPEIAQNIINYYNYLIKTKIAPATFID